jgi:O-acetyl-ADP-ribose deacetylase (regulator of RNase III)
MITYTSGNILEADVDAVINTVNTVGVMGKGLALQFKRRYPANYESYRAACQRGEVQLGRMFVTEPHELTGPRFIINFPTKAHWRADSRLGDIERGLVDLVDTIRARQIASIAVPPLGAGNGGLDWRDVRPLIASALEPLENVDVLVFEPAAGHRRIAPGVAPKLTRGRALLLELVIAYARQRETTEPWETTRGASHLEIQKLMYFAARALPEMRVTFTRGMYGPYSDPVRIMVQEMEGSMLSGFGDGSDPVLALRQVEVTDLGIQALNEFRPTVEDADAIGTTVTSVMAAIQGFEGPYPLELLSSVQWARDEVASDDPGKITEYVQGWTERKGRLFTPKHIRTALAHLAG